MYMLIPCQITSRFVITAIFLFAIGLVGCDDQSDPNGPDGVHGVLTVAVQNAVSGAPAVGALVTLYPWETPAVVVVSARTDGRGQSRFENLAPGRYRITVEADELKDADEAVHINSNGSMSMTFSLQEIDSDLATLNLDVHLDYREAPQPFYLRARPEIRVHELDTTIRSNANGYLDPALLPAGEFTVTVRAAGFRSWTETLLFRRGKRTYRDVRLQPLDESEWIDRILAWYPLDGDGEDFSGFGCDGLLEGGAAAVTDRHGKTDGAIRFNGVDAQVRVPHDGFFGVMPFSVSLWLRSTAAGTTQGVLSMIEQQIHADFESKNGFHLFLQDGRPAGWYSGFVLNGTPEAGVVFPATGPAINDNGWHHLVYTFGDKAARVYVDGMAALEAEWISGGQQVISPMDADLHIGACPPLDGQPRQHFDGAMDDVRLFLRELTASEVQVLLNN